MGNRLAWLRPVGALAVLVLVLALAVAAPARGAASAAQTNEILVGALLTLIETVDPDTQAALAIATDEINQYLSDSGSGRRIRLLVEGAGYDEDVAVEKLRLLASQGVKVIVGPETSDELGALKGPADQLGIVLISHCATAPSFAIPGDSIFRLVPDDTRQADALARIMADDGVRVIVPLWRSGLYGDDLTAATKASFEKLGGMVLDGVRFDPEAESFAADLRDLAARVTVATSVHGADAVAVHYLGFGPESSPILNEAQNHPVLDTVRWYGSDGTVQSREIAGDERAARFVIETGLPSPLFAVPDTRKAEQVRAKIRERIGGPSQACALAAYDALWLTALTSLATGGLEDVAAFKRAFPRTADTYFGATGWTALNAAGDRDVADYDFWAVKEEGGAFRWDRVARYVAGPDGGRIVRPASQE